MFNQILNFNRNRSLNQLPQMNKPIEGWQIPITLIRITQKIVDGDKVESQENIRFLGVVQPLSPERLQFLPDGLRSWEWLLIHCKAGTLNLQTQDKIIFNNKRYKVMTTRDYSLYSYIEYEIVRDYE